MSQAKVVRLLRQLSSLMKNMDDKEADEFLADLEAAFRARERIKTRVPARLPRNDERFDARDVVKKLLEAPTRDDGAKILELEARNRRQLSEIARAADVYVTKEDPVGLIQEKIVEALIGARLNSLAIRGQ